MVARVLLYKDLFEDDEPKISDLLKDISSNLTIGVFSFINSLLYLDNSLNNEHKILSHLVGRIDKKERLRIIKKYEDLSRDEDNLIAFPIISILRLIEDEVLNYRVIDKESPTGIDELNLFKAIIIQNAAYEKERLSKISNRSQINFLRLIWLLGYEQVEHSRSGLFSLIPSIYFADRLLEYLKKTDSPNYKKFLKKYGQNDYKEYLKNYLTLIQNGIKIKEGKVIYVFKTNLIKKHPFLLPFCLDMQNFDSVAYVENGKNIDFIGLREKPLIKHTDNEFTVTNWNFIINKFLLGLMFDYYHSIYPERGTKAFLRFKEDLGENFVEKTFLKEILFDIITPNEHLDILADDKTMGYNFDFYIRVDNKIFIIECKDYLFPAKVKSGGILSAENYLNERLGGAVQQIKKQILKFNNSEYKNIKIPYPKERLIVFPIIVLTDKTFSVPGIDNFLNKNLQKLLSKENLDFFLTWELKTIHIDFFIKYRGILKENPRLLLTLLSDAYHKKAAYKKQALHIPSVNNVLLAESNFENLLRDKLIKLDDNSLHEIVIKRLK